MWRQPFSNVEVFVNFQLPIMPTKIAAFDLDHTLVAPHYGTFPRNENDFVIMKNREGVLRWFLQNDYTLIIFTNQARSKEMNKTRIENFVRSINIPFIVIMSTAKENQNSIYRKPNVGMWNLLKQMINIESAFYVGDAAGRPTDFSDSDLQFAKNVDIKFYTPEEVFPS